VLNGKSPNRVYKHPSSDLVLFPRNYQLSDDVAFRFSEKSWAAWPLTASTYAGWIKSIPKDQDFICLGMDYETFGEHQKADTGILLFLKQFLAKMARHKKIVFATPSEVIGAEVARDVVSTERIVSWADESRDTSAWLGNGMQRDAFASLYRLLKTVSRTNDPSLKAVHQYLQTSDHFYYMSTKKGNDGNVHQYFSPFESPYEAFMNYMNVLSDLEFRVNATQERTKLTVA
jgi:alpha-amylase